MLQQLQSLQLRVLNQFLEKFQSERRMRGRESEYICDVCVCVRTFVRGGGPRLMATVEGGGGEINLVGSFVKSDDGIANKTYFDESCLRGLLSSNTIELMTVRLTAAKVESSIVVQSRAPHTRQCIRWQR